MQQIVDLQKSEEFRALNMELLSLSPDPLDSWKREGERLGIQLPLLSDADNEVAERYGVMEWAMGNEPGHTFVLVDEEGKVTWVRDYGAVQNGGLMYVEPSRLISDLSDAIKRL